jgi:coenzyme F420 biosynthesis associated uncharacterized protein
MIDWGLARRVAGYVSPDAAPVKLPGDLQALASEAEGLVSGYTGLTPAAPLPAAEAIDRGQWIDANLASMRELMGPVFEKAQSGLPASGIVRSGMGSLLGAQVGALTGYLSGRVLGQYDLVLMDADSPTRLLLVAPNLDKAAAELGADREDLLTWVTLHEVTHALQFTGVPWLRGHLAGLLRLLLDSMDVSFDVGRALKLPSAEDLRALVDTLRKGDLMSLVASPEQRDLLDRIQATMAVLEGHAEHVMDATGAELLPALPRLRSSLDARRENQNVITQLVNRLLGLDLKLRQYVVGKRFIDAIVEARGPEVQTALFASPSAFPTLSELSDPNSWLGRVNVPSVTS